MSKSLAETVNFAEAVQKKQYEKRAQQVDTFVRSETAEQKLARSGKMQTAKALEALASLGGTVFDAQAKQSEQRVALLKEDLANITAVEIQEQRNGAAPYSSETFASLPLRFQTKVRQSVGYERGKRLIAEAEASIDPLTLLDDAAKITHIESFHQDLELASGMDAHELLGYNKGWQEGVDRINNASLKAKTVEGEKKIENDFKSGVAGIVTKEHESFLQLQANGDLANASDYFKIDLRNKAAKRTFEQIEVQFKNYNNEAGVKVPAEIKKRWVRESVLEAAKATKNPYLLDPANVPVEYQDETTKYFFAQARVDLKKSMESEQRSQVAADNAQRVADRNKADEDAFNGTITLDTPDLTLAQTNALIAFEERGKLTGGASTKNKNNFMLQVQKSITEGSPVLLDMDNNPVLDKHGDQVSLDRASLDDYLLYNPMFLDNEQTYLSNNLGGLLIGIDTAANFPESQVTALIEGNAVYSVPEAQIPNFVLNEMTQAKRLYKKMFREVQSAKGYDSPLTPDEIDDLNFEFFERMGSNVKPPQSDGEVNLEGETSNTVTVEPEVQGTSAPQTYEDLAPNFKEAWENIKDNPDQVKKWQDRGLPVPEVKEEAVSLEDMTVNEYAENAIEMLQANIPTLPWTMRAEANEFLQRIRENPQVAFEDSKFNRYYDGTFKLKND